MKNASSDQKGANALSAAVMTHKVDAKVRAVTGFACQLSQSALMSGRALTTLTKQPSWSFALPLY
jgi:hypothetical protein